MQGEGAGGACRARRGRGGAPVIPARTRRARADRGVAERARRARGARESRLKTVDGILPHPTIPFIAHTCVFQTGTAAVARAPVDGVEVQIVLKPFRLVILAGTAVGRVGFGVARARRVLVAVVHHRGFRVMVALNHPNAVHSLIHLRVGRRHRGKGGHLAGEEQALVFQQRSWHAVRQTGDIPETPGHGVHHRARHADAVAGALVVGRLGVAALAVGAQFGGIAGNAVGSSSAMGSPIHTLWVRDRITALTFSIEDVKRKRAASVETPRGALCRCVVAVVHTGRRKPVRVRCC